MKSSSYSCVAAGSNGGKRGCLSTEYLNELGTHIAHEEPTKQTVDNPDGEGECLCRVVVGFE